MPEDAPPRILLIEDSSDDAFLCRRALAGYTVEHVTTLGAALERLAGSPFDLVLSDLNLPDASGLEVIQKLRASHPDVALVVLTGAADEQMSVDALAHG